MRSTHYGKSVLAIVAWAAALAGGGPPVAADDRAATLVVEGGMADLGETPLVVDLASGQLAPGRYLLQPDAPGAAPLAALAFRDGEAQRLGVILPGVPARSTARYAIRPDPSPAEPGQGVALVAEGARVAVQLDGKLWTRYVPDDGPKPYLDPLNGPAGQPLTRAWPMRTEGDEPHDHPHHRSLWFAHLDVNKANTWDQNPGHGSIRETSRPTVVGGGPIGVLRTTDDWLDRTGRKVCADERVVQFYATREARVFDFEVTLKADAGPVVIGDNKDGVFGIRVAAPMAVTAHRGGRIVNSRGQQDAKAWGQPAEWVDYSGPVGGETQGIAILNQPTSFRYPTTWHVRDYGLFAANPFGWHDFGQGRSGEHRIEAGGSIRLAYRVVLHRGDVAAADPARQFRALTDPPRVKVE